MLMYLAGMTNIPTEVYEAAIVDGAGRMSRFFRITLPMLKNTTIFLAITTLISLTQLFDQPYQEYGDWPKVARLRWRSP